MVRVRGSLLACTCVAAIIATPAQASVDEYSVGGEASVVINLEVCTPESQLAVRGDTTTDLDFVVTSPSGEQVHSDQGIDDYLSIVIDNESGGCATFALGVSNLGEERNAFTVVLEPIFADSTRIEKYIIQGNETQTVDFKACGTSAELTARGDGDTDLDFIVRNSDGGVVHEDDDLTDETSATLAGLLSNCETFEMEVSNLGAVYNALMVVVDPEGATRPVSAPTAPSTSLASGISGEVLQAESEGAGEYRANANSAINVNLPVCGVTRLEVRGDGDTDLDFTVTDSNGDRAHSDFDLSDITFATLTPSGPAGACETFAMEVSNLGDVFNVFTVALVDAGNRGGISGAGEYRVNANAATKVPLRACTLTNVFVRGDGDTDLDYDVTDQSGTNVHSNYDYSDQTQFSLTPEDGCTDFQLSVSNLGNVFNVMTITMDDGPDVVAIEQAQQTQLTIPPPAPPSPSRPARSARVIGSGAGEYRAPSNDTVRIDLPICDRTVISVEGNGDTDLDFDIYSSSGSNVHSNYDLSDRTYTALAPNDGCEDFSMTIQNLGNVYNDFRVSYVGGLAAPPEGNGRPPIETSVTPPPPITVVPAPPPPSPPRPPVRQVGSGEGEYRAPANATVQVDLPVCERTFVSIEGDGDTDLDYDIFAPDGSNVHSDYDLTDRTYTALTPSGGCQTFNMTVQNLGGVYNVFTVSYAGGSGGGNSSAVPVSSGGATTATAIAVPEDNASTDGNNRNIAILNQTGEVLTFIYWSNSATLDWGEDKLGSSSTLSAGQQWNVNASDGSDACLFDFKAVTASSREIEVTRVNVCEVTSVAFE